MNNTFSVLEMSEKLGKDKSTIYNYIKSGKLEGTKVNNIWQIKYKPINVDTNTDIVLDDEKVDLSKPAITIKKIINENAYKNVLQKKLNNYERVLEDITNNLRNEAALNKSIANIEKTKFTNTLLKTFERIVENNETYKYINTNKIESKKELEELLGNYEELNLIIKPLTVEKLQYSTTTDSVYVYIDKVNLVAFLNRLSEVNKRFVIISDDIMTRDEIKFRFSNHIPDYYKEETLNILKSNREVDVIVPYKKLEENFTVIPKKQTKEDKKDIKELNVKIEATKKYVNKPVKALNKQQLKDYYDLLTGLLNSDVASTNDFIKSLRGRETRILKMLNTAS